MIADRFVLTYEIKNLTEFYAIIENLGLLYSTVSKYVLKPNKSSNTFRLTVVVSKGYCDVR